MLSQALIKISGANKGTVPGIHAPGGGACKLPLISTQLPKCDLSLRAERISAGSRGTFLRQGHRGYFGLNFLSVLWPET